LKKLWERIGDKFSTDASCAAMLEGGGILTTPQGEPRMLLYSGFFAERFAWCDCLCPYAGVITAPGAPGAKVA
jgi:hypothetical protein